MYEKLQMLKAYFRDTAVTCDGRACERYYVWGKDSGSANLSWSASGKGDAFKYPGTIPGDTIHLLASASYMNFVIANGVVLIPKYWREGLSLSQKEKDDNALKLMHDVFPGKKIIQINVTELNFGGGGMHCLTQQQPGIAKE